jgi:hypothetical protein
MLRDTDAEDAHGEERQKVAVENGGLLHRIGDGNALIKLPQRLNLSDLIA